MAQVVEQHRTAVRQDVLVHLANMGVDVNPESGAVSLSEDLSQALSSQVQPNGHTHPAAELIQTAQQWDMSQFREREQVRAVSDQRVSAPTQPVGHFPELPMHELERPMTRREVLDLVTSMQGRQVQPQQLGMSAPPAAGARPIPPSLPPFGTSAVAEVLAKHLADAGRRRP